MHDYGLMALRTAVCADPLYRTLVVARLSTAVVFTVACLGRCWYRAPLDGRGDGALNDPLWKVAALLAITVLLLVDARPAGYACVLAQLLMGAFSLVLGGSQRGARTTCPPTGAPAADGAHLGALALSVLACWGRPERLRPQLPVGQNWIVPSCQVCWRHPRGSSSVARVFASSSGQIFNCDPQRRSIGLCGSGALMRWGLLQWLLVALPPAGRVAGGIYDDRRSVGQLEAISRGRPDRVLRLAGLRCPAAINKDPAARTAIGARTLQLLIFPWLLEQRHHPTAFDPDQAALPRGGAGECRPAAGAAQPRDEQLPGGASDADALLGPQPWLGSWRAIEGCLVQTKVLRGEVAANSSRAACPRELHALEIGQAPRPCPSVGGRNRRRKRAARGLMQGAGLKRSRWKRFQGLEPTRSRQSR